MVLIPYDQYIDKKSKSADSHVISGEGIQTKSHTTHESLTPDTKTKLSKDLIIFPITSQNKRKAESLLKYVSEKMDWNEKGELITGGKTHEGSHVTDLLQHALAKTSKSNSNPISSTYFYTNLMHAPKSLFHPSKLKLITGKGEEEEEESDPASSYHHRDEKSARLPPPGIPVNTKPISLMDPSIWTNKWRKI